MAENLQISSPDFDRIKKGDFNAIHDAINLLWMVGNNEASVRARTVQQAQNRLSPKVQADAPLVGQNNYDGGDTSILSFEGATNFNLTGIRNGIDGWVRVIHNLGSGTITLKYESASSDASNRIDTVTAADKTVTTGQTAFLVYRNHRWRLASFV